MLCDGMGNQNPSYDGQCTLLAILPSIFSSTIIKSITMAIVHNSPPHTSNARRSLLSPYSNKKRALWRHFLL